MIQSQHSQTARRACRNHRAREGAQEPVVRAAHRSTGLSEAFVTAALLGQHALPRKPHAALPTSSASTTMRCCCCR